MHKPCPGMYGTVHKDPIEERSLEAPDERTEQEPSRCKQPFHLKHQRSTLGLLITAQLEMLASLQCQLRLGLAYGTLQSQHDLLGCLRLLVEDGLGLTTVTGLLSVITTLSLGK